MNFIVVIDNIVLKTVMALTTLQNSYKLFLKFIIQMLFNTRFTAPKAKMIFKEAIFIKRVSQKR